jgi:hypothetical protein
MISVGFSNSNTWLSKIIQWFTGSTISHCWLLLDPGTAFYGQQKWVLEAVLQGYHLIPYEGYTVGNHLVSLVTLPYPVEDGVIRAMGWLGGSYDVGGLLGEAVVVYERWLERTWRWLKFKIRNPLHEQRAMFCSEAIVFVLQVSKYPGADALIAKNTTPQDLYAFLTKDVVPVDHAKRPLGSTSL